MHIFKHIKDDGINYNIKIFTYLAILLGSTVEANFGSSTSMLSSSFSSSSSLFFPLLLAEPNMGLKVDGLSEGWIKLLPPPLSSSSFEQQ